MKVKNLVIERKETYDADYPGLLVGLVQIQGEHGKMEVKLSNAVIADIFKIVKDDVQKTANYNAAQAGGAIDDSANEFKLIENI